VSADDGALSHARRHLGVMCKLDSFYLVSTDLRNDFLIASFEYFLRTVAA
jgi:hypothetical protein